MFLENIDYTFFLNSLKYIDFEKYQILKGWFYLPI